MSHSAQHDPTAQPAYGWLAVAAFAAAMFGLILVFDATWATIALCVLALGIQAYRRARLHPEDGDRIAVAVGTFGSAAIGGVLVLVDKLWLAIPITAAALGIDGVIRARREAKRKSGGRVAFRAVAEAIARRVAALLGPGLAIASSLLPLAIAQYRRMRDDPQAVRANIKLLWIGVLEILTAAMIAYAVFWVAFLPGYHDAAHDFHRMVETHRPFTAPDLSAILEATGAEAPTSIYELEQGDCIRARETVGPAGYPPKVPKVPCGTPHRVQVYSLIELDLGAGYPGTAVLDGKGTRGCRARLRRGFPQSFGAPGVESGYVYPTPRSWADGDREITCLARFSTARRGNLTG
jgi:hypothetical protein